MRPLILAISVLCLTANAVYAQDPAPVHGVAMHGEPKYGPDFSHFDYVNPYAPKGGTLRVGVPQGSFDSLNNFIIRGNPASGLGSLYDTLVTSSSDEAFTQYGLIAESIEMPEDRSWVIFNLRPEARFHDGHPLTADDVIFSFDILKDKGLPHFRAYYKNVTVAEKLGDHRIKFVFGEGENRELPLIIGQLPILPKHYWETREFDKTTLEPPLGSGPYKVQSVEPGRSISYARVEDYWGEDIPVNRGQNNFDLIIYDYYRDADVAIEALKAGAFDIRAENSAKNWATAYDIPAVDAGRLILDKIPTQMPEGMQSFAFNSRRFPFADRQVRRALTFAFDFETTNKNLFYGQYTRTKSYFSNSELASSGLPEGKELEILEQFRGRIPDEVFTTPYTVPETDGNGNVRANLRTAVNLLKDSGWEIRDGKMIEIESGRPLEFEILLAQPQAAFERIFLPFIQNLERIGVSAELRRVDVSQFQNRLDNFDFDMIIGSWGQSLSPGNEQRNYWSSESATINGSRNYVGISDPAIDELIELVISAPDRESLVIRTRALDRVLLWGHYVIPNWHLAFQRLVYWNKFGRPDTLTLQGTSTNYWWVDPEKEAALGDYSKN